MTNVNLKLIEIANNLNDIIPDNDIYRFTLSIFREFFYNKSDKLNNYDLDMYMDIFENNFKQIVNSESVIITFNVLMNEKVKELTLIKIGRKFTGFNLTCSDINSINELNDINKEKIIKFINSLEYNNFLKNIILKSIDITIKNTEIEYILLNKSYKNCLIKEQQINKNKISLV